MQDLKLMLRDYRLTTVEILYELPDHPNLVQTFVWQCIDLPPHYPRTMRFLHHWHTSIDGKIRVANVANVMLVTPSDFRYLPKGGILRLH